ncbi:MAG TPA: cytochrome c oxidase assembly protein [Gemmatimonadales bacterium]|jgi:putative membrane protein|nr:cytochrome c oxidase assembly protein [Gemmatimonadales bacterium]
MIPSLLPAPGPWQRWDLHPSVVIGLVLLGGLYGSLGGLQAPRRQVVAFCAALLVLFVALNGPLHNLSDTYLFSAHMAQHLILTLVFPPLLLYGTPAWVVRPLLRSRWVFRFARWAARPLAAGVLFSAPITLWHFPQLYEAALEHHGLHIVQHLVFIATAVLMWWPVLSPVPELPRASYPTQLLYLFALGLPMSLAGALITLAERVLYPFYAAAPRVWGLAPVADQQLGGLLMWVVGTIYLWVAASVVWFRWSVRAEREDADLAVPAAAYVTRPLASEATRPRPSPPTDGA